MRLAESRDDLRHLKPEHPICVSERGTMALRVTLVPFGRMRPDLNTLTGKRFAIACTAHSSRHPKTSATDPIYNRGAWTVVVGPASHRERGCKALCVCGDTKAGNSGRYNGAACSEEGTAGER